MKLSVFLFLLCAHAQKLLHFYFRSKVCCRRRSGRCRFPENRLKSSLFDRQHFGCFFGRIFTVQKRYLSSSVAILIQQLDSPAVIFYWRGIFRQYKQICPPLFAHAINSCISHLCDKPQASIRMFFCCRARSRRHSSTSFASIHALAAKTREIYADDTRSISVWRLGLTLFIGCKLSVDLFMSRERFDKLTMFNVLPTSLALLAFIHSFIIHLYSCI